MQVHKPIKLFVPKAILKIINGIDIRNKENLIFIIHYVLSKPARNKQYTEKKYNFFVPLNIKKLTTILGCKPYRYIKILEKYELLECDKKYITGKKSFYYRLSSKYKFEGNFYELLPDNELFKNIIHQIKNSRTNLSKKDDHIVKMYKKFLKINFDIEGALKWILSLENNYKKSTYLTSVYLFSDQRFRYFKRNQTNKRLDTNLTNLKKELRQFIEGDLISIDLANSQPLLLWHLINIIQTITDHFINNNMEINKNNINRTKDNRNHQGAAALPLCFNNGYLDLFEFFGIQAFKDILKIRKNSHNPFFTNFSVFQDWVTNGVFYDNFKAKFDDNRDKAKDAMIKVLFSQNEIYREYKRFIPYESEKKIFSKEFPVIYKIIEQLKSKQHNNLAIYLQRLESNLFIDNIAKKLVENNIIPITIHDSIIISSYQKEEALSITKAIFKNQFGTIPKFHIKLLN